MIIRQANPQDYGALSTLIEQVDNLHRRQLPHVFQKADQSTTQRDYILGLIAAENVGVFVAEQENRLIGFVVVLVRLTPDIPILVKRCYALIENIGVAEDYQSQGVGKALMGRAHQWAAENGANRVELTVYEFNQAAKDFYESLGYHTESRRMSIKLEYKSQEDMP